MNPPNQSSPVAGEKRGRPGLPEGILILLIGPKGAGKSHIGRLLESRLGVHFLDVEPLWMAYYAACKAEGSGSTVCEGIERVHPAINAALATHKHVCVETTGASREILDDLLRRREETRIVLVKVHAPLALCMERTVSRDQRNQIPMDAESIRRVYELGRALDVPFDLVLENVALSSEDVLRQFVAVLGHGEET